MRNHGVAILPVGMFEIELERGWLVQPFPLAVTTGSYWLVRLRSRELTAAMIAFRDWVCAEAEGGLDLEEVLSRTCSG